MIANRYCQVDFDQDDAYQIDDQGRFFSSHYEAVAEQYLRMPVNDNKSLKSVTPSSSKAKIYISIACVTALIIGYSLLQN